MYPFGDFTGNMMPKEHYNSTELITIFYIFILSYFIIEKNDITNILKTVLFRCNGPFLFFKSKSSYRSYITLSHPVIKRPCHVMLIPIFLNVSEKNKRGK